MKKNLIIALAVLVIAAMAIPASAAQLIFSGELNAKLTPTRSLTLRSGHLLTRQVSPTSI